MFFSDQNADSYFFNLCYSALCLTFSRIQGSSVEVRTNSAIKQLLSQLFNDVEFIEQAEQPFGDHHWELNKITSYSKQSNPFIHLDHDVFISQNVGFEKFSNFDFLVQHNETGDKNQILGLKSSYHFAKNNGHTFPEYVDALAVEDKWTQYNMGTFGCWNIDKLKKYCKDVFLCAKEGPLQFQKQSMLYEQFLFTAFCKKENASVAMLLDGDINDEAKKMGYCHMQGGKYIIKQAMSAVASLKRNNIRAFELLSKSIKNSAICQIANNNYKAVLPQMYFGKLAN